MWRLLVSTYLLLHILLHIHICSCIAASWALTHRSQSISEILKWCIQLDFIGKIIMRQQKANVPQDPAEISLVINTKEHKRQITWNKLWLLNIINIGHMIHVHSIYGKLLVHHNCFDVFLYLHVNYIILTTDKLLQRVR